MKQEGELDMACGIIACLHAIFNNLPQVGIEPDSVLSRFLSQVKDKTPAERAVDLDQCRDFKVAHQEAASQGQNQSLDDAGKLDTTHHFIAFVMNDRQQLLLMDGCRDGPVVMAEGCGDVLRDTIKVVQSMLQEGKLSQSMSMLTLNAAEQ